MYIKKSVLAVCIVCSLAVGYGACALVGTLSAEGNLLSGDISKADLYSGQKMDPDVAVVEERLQNDTAFLKQTQDAMALLKQHLDTLNNLADRTMSLCADVAEFKGVMPGISSLQVKAYNASLALERTAEELNKVADGKQSNLYEQASNNAFIGFIKTESQLTIGNEFVETATKYIGKKGEKVSGDLVRLVADWTVYCTEDAMINGSEDETAYWASNAEKLNGTLNSTFRLRKEMVNPDASTVSFTTQAVSDMAKAIYHLQPSGAYTAVSEVGFDKLPANHGCAIVLKAFPGLIGVTAPHYLVF